MASYSVPNPFLPPPTLLILWQPAFVLSLICRKFCCWYSSLPRMTVLEESCIRTAISSHDKMPWKRYARAPAATRFLVSSNTGIKHLHTTYKTMKQNAWISGYAAKAISCWGWVNRLAQEWALLVLLALARKLCDISIKSAESSAREFEFPFV